MNQCEPIQWRILIIKEIWYYWGNYQWIEYFFLEDMMFSIICSSMAENFVFFCAKLDLIEKQSFQCNCMQPFNPIKVTECEWNQAKRIEDVIFKFIPEHAKKISQVATQVGTQVALPWSFNYFFWLQWTNTKSSMANCSWTFFSLVYASMFGRTLTKTKKVNTVICFHFD